MIEPPVELMNKIQATSIRIGKELETLLRNATQSGYEQGYERGYKDCMEDKEYFNGTDESSVE